MEPLTLRFYGKRIRGFKEIFYKCRGERIDYLIIIYVASPINVCEDILK